MSVTTKTGDEGRTSLLSGERVWKDDLRVEAYATLDELNSALGLAKHGLRPGHQALVARVHRQIWRACAELAATTAVPRPITADDVKFLEEYIIKFEEVVPITGFVVPGRTPGSGGLDLCRTIVRRAERRLVALGREAPVPPDLRRWINRMSDFLFMMARHEEFLAAGGPEYVDRPDPV